MKILQINAVYGVGSTGRIVKDIHEDAIKNGIDSYVCWATKSNGENSSKIFRVGNTIDHKLHALFRRITLRQGFYSFSSTRNLCRKIDKIKPDVIHLHNLHSNYINLRILLEHVKKKNIPVLLTLHDTWFFTGLCTHYLSFGNCKKWQKGCLDCPATKLKNKVYKVYNEKKKLFEGIDNLAFNGVSKWITEAGANSLLSSAKTKRTIYNWIDANEFKRKENLDNVRKKYNLLPGDKVILGVSQGWSENKGLNEFRTIAKQVKGKAKVFLVGESYGAMDEDNLYFIGRKSKEELIELYSLSNVFVNPSRMETFGLVTAEAMSCEVPVVAYANTGSTEVLSEECGILVEDGNVSLMIEAILKVLKTDGKHYGENGRKRVLECFNKERQIQEYLTLYKEIALEKNN